MVARVLVGRRWDVWDRHRPLVHVLDGDVERGAGGGVEVVLHRHRDAVRLLPLVVEHGAGRDGDLPSVLVDLERRIAGEARDREGVAERAVLRVGRGQRGPDVGAGGGVLAAERPVTPPANSGLGNVGAVLVVLSGAVFNSEVASRVFALCPSL